MNKVFIFGAGFSGLVSAYFLRQSGWDVEIIEKSDSPGGLIQTVQTPYGPCERAANGILNSSLLTQIAGTVGLPLQGTLPESRKRYIFREKPRRWPLNLLETLEAGFKFISSPSKRPRPLETVSDWGTRVLTPSVTRFLLEPALQGIYAGDIKKMSASLIFNRLFDRKKRTRPHLKGLVSFQGGLSTFILGLEKFLKAQGVKFSYGQAGHLSPKDGAYFLVATSAPAAGEILKGSSPQFAETLAGLEMIDLVKATLFLQPESPQFEGFGVLFPPGEGFRLLGLLSDNHIFGGWTKKTESAVLGGPTDRECLNLTDSAILEVVQQDRQKLLKKEPGQVLGTHIQRWPKTLPHYTVDLEKVLRENQRSLSSLKESGIYLVGNYLGGLGLSQILESAKRVTDEMTLRMKTHG